MTLPERLDALAEVVELGTDRLPPDLLADARALSERAGERLRLSGEHTVVALAGATGSGKSSLFNEVLGVPLATVGVRRPTTSATQAAVVGKPGDAAALLDWLTIGTRQYVEQPAALAGLVLLDLPDHDSTEAEHRAEVDRLVRLVDAFGWVLDPQKYADAVLHDEYLRPLAAHREVMVVVLNQSDRLSPSDLVACVRDLDRLLADDGLAGVPVLATSAVTADGAAPLRSFLADTVTAHRARTQRIAADLTAVSTRLSVAVPARRSEPSLRDPGRQLQMALSRAAGVPTVVAAVGAAYERRALAAVGWPPLRWLARFRPDPLRRLGLGTSDSPDVLRRTSLPSGSAVSKAGVDSAVRSLADAAAAGLTPPWPARLAGAARSRANEVPDALDRAVGGATLGLERSPRWWRVGGDLQWALLATAVVGGLWLALLAGLGFVQIDLDAPSLGPFAWPTVLLVGGLMLGLALRVLLRPFVAVGAARRRRRSAASLRTRVAAVGEDLILAPLREELTAYGELAAAVRRLGR